MTYNYYTCTSLLTKMSFINLEINSIVFRFAAKRGGGSATCLRMLLTHLDLHHYRITMTKFSNIYYFIFLYSIAIRIDSDPHKSYDNSQHLDFFAQRYWTCWISVSRVYYCTCVICWTCWISVSGVYGGPPPAPPGTGHTAAVRC